MKNIISPIFCLKLVIPRCGVLHVNILIKRYCFLWGWSGEAPGGGYVVKVIFEFQNEPAA